MALRALWKFLGCAKRACTSMFYYKMRYVACRRLPLVFISSDVASIVLKYYRLFFVSCCFSQFVAI